MKRGRWISAERFLPFNALVEMRDGAREIGTGHFNGVSQRWLMGDGGDMDAPKPKVTHWRGRSDILMIETAEIFPAQYKQLSLLGEE